MTSELWCLSGGKRGDYQNCCIVYWSCAQSLAHLDEQFLQFSGLGFVTLGPFHCALIHLCLSLCILYFFILRICCIIVIRCGGPGGIEANSLDLSSFSAMTLFFGSFDPLEPIPVITYNVFGGTLTLEPPRKKKSRTAEEGKFTLYLYIRFYTR